MKERMFLFTCPNCHSQFHMKRDTLGIAGISDLLEKRIEQGTYFTHICSHCHQPFYLEYPFIYRDPQKQFILVLSDQKMIDVKQGDEMIVRCKNVPQFLLAYRILHQQLNVELVLQKKHQLEQKLKSPCQFDRYDQDHQCLWFQCQKEWVAIKMDAQELQQIKERGNV